MDIVQTFYDNLATQYDKLFENWQQTTHEQALILNKLFNDNGFDKNAKLLDCACGIGTQAIGLASLGYKVTASDLSQNAVEQAKTKTNENKFNITFKVADFCNLQKTFDEQFDIVIAMDNALPHMLTHECLQKAVQSIINQIAKDGIFVASIRDYDELLKNKPLYSPPYIHKTENGRRICFQTWEWHGENYKLVQYITEDEKTLQTSKFECEYRATKRDELTKLLFDCGCTKVEWKFGDETGFYQPIVIAKK